MKTIPQEHQSQMANRHKEIDLVRIREEILDREIEKYIQAGEAEAVWNLRAMVLKKCRARQKELIADLWTFIHSVIEVDQKERWTVYQNNETGEFFIDNTPVEKTPMEKVKEMLQ